MNFRPFAQMACISLVAVVAVDLSAGLGPNPKAAKEILNAAGYKTVDVLPDWGIPHGACVSIAQERTAFAYETPEGRPVHGCVLEDLFRQTKIIFDDPRVGMNIEAVRKELKTAFDNAHPNLDVRQPDRSCIGPYYRSFAYPTSKGKTAQGCVDMSAYNVLIYK